MQQQPALSTLSSHASADDHDCANDGRHTVYFNDGETLAGG